MAKTTGSKSGNSKIRFIMLEADLNEGDLSQVTQAIQNALRPAPTGVRVLQALPKPAGVDETETLDSDELANGDADRVDEPPRKVRTSKPKVVKPPKVVDGIDWETDPSLMMFAEGFDIKTDFERFLVIALWFREHRDTPAITPGHVYTAYRQLEWPTSIPSFLKPFQNMRDNQLFTGDSKEGFSINQLGEGKIRKKKRG